MKGNQIAAKSAKHMANEHIDGISARLEGILEVEGAGDLIEPMLHFFKEDIYSTSTHFILELIQNADDNKYAEGCTPTLALSYQHRRLRTDCNELGFTRGDVDAICKIGLSNKKNQVESTGEKGVGFKSVFGVADCVWIASNDYTFKFDSSKPMGILIPIWEELPGARIENTSMYIQFRVEIDEGRVFNGLHHLGAKVLIFLRQLRQIQWHIELKSGNKVYCNIRREDQMSSDRLLTTRLMFSGETFSTPQLKDYLVCHYRILDMPGDVKRPGLSESDMKLAFPVGDSGQPLLESQDVYASLPVRSYGFTFLLQGDFLLSTSREEISSSREWNVKICESLPDAFTEAVETIVAYRREFPWFRFLPDVYLEENLFQKAKKEIPDRVAKERVLMSEGLDENGQGLLAIPSSLGYIPREFRDSNGVPLTLCTRKMNQYLSTKYLHEDWCFLQRLGVQQMSSEEFMNDLDWLVKNDGVQDKPVEWHQSLATAVNQLVRNPGGEKFRSMLCTLAILPLQNNEWISSTDSAAGKTNRAVFLHLTNERVPRGLAVFEIRRDAIDGRLRSDRVKFFKHAGALEYNASVVCDLIVDQQTVQSHHWQANRGPSRLKDNRVSDLAEQLRFLYKHDWTDKEHSRTLWVLNEQYEPRPASAVYIPSSEPDSAAVLLKGISKIELMHKDYLGFGGGDESEFIEWLRSTFGIWRVPRLADRSNKLSPDFQHVINTTPSPIWLRLLEKYYNQYYIWLVPKARKAQAILESLKSAEVECLNNEKALLAKTCRPGLERFLEEKCLVLDRDFKEWSLLKNLGVIVEVDLEIYFSKLKELESKGTRPSDAEIRQLYSDIQDKSEGSWDKIRKAFRDDGLIYVPSLELGAPNSWLRPGEGCIWKGPKSLRHTPKLQELYPDNELLFKEILKVGNAGPSLLLQEIAEYKPTALADILSLLKDAESLWGRIDEVTSTLMKRWRIFPVREPSDPNVFVLRSASDIWGIPDERLRAFFCKKLALLAFTYDAFSNMRKIRLAFNLDTRKLQVTNRIFYEDRNPISRSLATGKFMERIKLMSRLISKEMPDMHKKLGKLFTAQLYSVDEIISALTVQHGGREIAAEKLKVECLLTDDENDLKIYLTKSCINRQIFPSELADQLSQLYCISERALAQDALSQHPDYVREKLTNLGYTEDMEYRLPEEERDVREGRRISAEVNDRTSSMHPEVIRRDDQRQAKASAGWTAKERMTASTPIIKKQQGSRSVSGQAQNVSLSSPGSTSWETQPEEQTGSTTQSSLGPVRYAVPRSSLENTAISASDQALVPPNKVEEVVFERDGDVRGEDEKNEHMREPANRQDEPTKLKGSSTEISKDFMMPRLESNQDNQQQILSAKSIEETILLQIQDRPPNIPRDLRFSGGMNEDQMSSLYHQVIDVVVEKYRPDIPMRKGNRQQVEVTAKPRPAEKPPLATGQALLQNILQDPQPKVPQLSGYRPQEKLALPRRHINESDLSREPQPLRETHEIDFSRRQSGRAPVAASPGGKALVIGIPDFPRDSLRDFLQNRVKHKVRKELAEIIFLPADKGGLGASDFDIYSSSIKTHAGRVHINEVTKTKKVFVALPNLLHQEETFLSEFLISRLLKTELKGFYAPETHWTRPWRERAGYGSYKSQNDPNAPHTAFLLPNASVFTAYLVHHGCEYAKRLTDKSVTYHLDVQVTSGNLDAPFQIHYRNFEMARATSIDEAGSTEVYCLIRVYNIYASPKYGD